MNGFSVKLEVDVRKVTIELLLYRAIKAGFTISNEAHTYFEPLCKDQPDELFACLIAKCGDILSV